MANPTMQRLITLMVVIAMCVTMATGLKCYSCVSCGSDPVDVTDLQTCDTGNVCLKTKGSIGGVSAVTRICANIPGATGSKCEAASEGGVSGTTCYCDQELCNGATNKAPSGFFVVVVCFVCAIGYKLLG